MTEETRDIERQIASARDTLGRQLSEVEEKAKDAIDWRSHYRRNPFPMLAAAAAAGFIVSGWLGDDEQDSDLGTPRPRRALALRSPAMNNTMDTMMDALIAAASAKAAEYIEDWIPGFHQEFTRRKG